MDWNRILGILGIPGAQYADIFLERTTLTQVGMDDRKVERVVTGTEEGVGLRIIGGLRTFHAHTNDLRSSRVRDLAERLAREAEGGGTPLPAPRLPPAPPGRRRGGTGPGMGRKIRLVRLAERVARGHSPTVRQVTVSLVERRQELTIVGPGREVTGSRCDTVMAVQTVAAAGDALERGYEAEGMSRDSSFLTEELAERLAGESARRAVTMARASTAPAGVMPVVLSSRAGGTMVHEAIGHGLENDLAGQGLSVYTGKIGVQVASPLISVADDPTLPGRRGSYAFDDEGTPARRNLLVEGGILRSFLSDLLSAARFGGETTGNARRQSFRHLPIPRMSNTLILPGSDDPGEILRRTGTGIFVVRMGGGQVNTVNGDFVFEVAEGYRIQGGEIGPPLRGALLVGNGPAVLREIDMVGSDLGFAVGTCGKDGQGVPVADAQPTLRLPAITVGGRL